ncbi:FtsQ-type POTRA domain-containing protein, partial [Acidobacteriota bacterium]
MSDSKKPPSFGIQISKPSESQQFKRKEGRTHTKKLHRKIKLRSRHIFLSFIFLVGFFFMLQQVFLFAISWDKLEIKEVSIFCENQAIKINIQDTIEDYHFGNILLFDSQNFRKIIESFTRVKNATIRKKFPLSLEILIE